jgi:hypothetical protein
MSQHKPSVFRIQKLDDIVLEYGSAYLDQNFCGENHMVEADEALLFKRQANVGRVLLGQRFWVLGSIDRTTKAKNSK